MGLLTKSLYINHCFKRFSISYYPFNELRLNRPQCCVSNNSLHFKSRILNPENCRAHAVSFVPERKFMDTYLGTTVKTKVVNAYDSLRFLGRTEERHLGFKWFSTLDDVNYNEFISLLQLPDTFFSWFKVMELHAWMLLLNLPQKTRAQKVTRIGLISAMWIDTESRSEILAPQNKNFKKNMKVLYERFQVSLYLYDDAYFNSDRELCSAIWYNFFEKENVDPRFMEVLVSYVRYQVHHLSTVELLPEKLDDKNLKLWTPLFPHYENVFQGH